MQLKVNDILVGSRRAELAAVRDGFCAAVHLQPQLQVLTASDLALIIHGPEHITAADVLATIRFEESDFPPESGMPGMLETVVSAMDEQKLRQLVLFVTGESSIPIGGAYQLSIHSRVFIGLNRLSHTLAQVSEIRIFTLPTQIVSQSRAVWEERLHYQLRTCAHIRWTSRCILVYELCPRSCIQRWNCSKGKASR